MERASLYTWILSFIAILSSGSVHGQTCRPNAPRRDCGKYTSSPEGFPRVNYGSNHFRKIVQNILTVPYLLPAYACVVAGCRNC